jgi:hypothetical protein
MFTHLRKLVRQAVSLLCSASGLHDRLTALSHGAVSGTKNYPQHFFANPTEAIDFIRVLWGEGVCQKGSKKAKILVIESECTTCFLL